MKQRLTFVVLLVLLPVAIGLGATPARASASFAVNATLDARDASPGNGVCETAAGNAVCTLRAAIEETNALVGADTITVPTGTYTLSLTGADEDLAATGDLDITDALTISGTNALSTTIDGGLIDRVLQIDPGPISSGVVVTITGVLIRNGALTGTTPGAGIHNNGKLTLRGVAVSGNRASGSAGGIYNFNGAELTMVDSLVSGNTAGSSEVGGNGAGINNWLATASLTNVTISGNQAANDGGGIFSGAPGGGNQAHISLTNVTVVNNIAGPGSGDSGGGMFVLSGIASITNTIVARNSSAGPGKECFGSVSSGGHNLIGDAAECTLIGVSTGNLIGVNALLGPLQNNGGATPTHALLPGSLATDAGDPASCPPTDQRGRPRPFDGNGDGSAVCDIGAYESQAAARSIYLPLVLLDNLGPQ